MWSIQDLFLVSNTSLFRPQMKHLSLTSISSWFWKSLMSAKASIMIPKIKFSRRIITMQKYDRSNTYLIQYLLASLSKAIYSKTSPIPPLALKPLFSVEVKHSSKVLQ